jgi:hypothetical protein
LDLGAFDPCRDTIVLIWLLWTLTGIPLFAISYLWPIILEKQFQIDAADQYWRMIIFVVVEVILIPKLTSPWPLTLCAGRQPFLPSRTRQALPPTRSSTPSDPKPFFWQSIGILTAFLMLDVPSIGRKGTVAIFSLLTFLFMMFASFFTYADIDTVQAVFLLVKVAFHRCRATHPIFPCIP